MQLDDVLITSVGILEDFLLVIPNTFITLSAISMSTNLCSRYKDEQSLSNSTVYTHAEQFLFQSLINSIFITSYPCYLFYQVLYFGYENYLFFVSTKILKIRSETETALRYSSSLVSLVGNVARILGVCLRINKCAHNSTRKKRKLDLFYRKKKLLEKTIHDEDKKNDVPIYNEIFAASISHNKVSSREKLYELGLAGRATHVLDLNHVAIKEELGEDDEEDDEEEGSSEDYSLLTQEMDNTEVLTSDIIADNDNDFHLNYSETPHIISTDSDSRRKSSNNNNKHEKKSANEKKLENENRKRTLLSYAEVGNRLVEDINHAEEERRTLCSDAVVVRYIELFCSLYLYVCVCVRINMCVCVFVCMCVCVFFFECFSLF